MLARPSDPHPAALSEMQSAARLHPGPIPAQDEPDTPATEVLAEDEQEVIGVVVLASGCFRRLSAGVSSRLTSVAGST